MASLGNITITDDLEWIDEFHWNAGVEQSVSTSTTGAVIVQEIAKPKARPITLMGGEYVWERRSVIESIQTLATQAGQTHRLILADGREFDVMFRRDSGSPIEARPVLRKQTYNADHDYNFITIRLMTV